MNARLRFQLLGWAVIAPTLFAFVACREDDGARPSSVADQAVATPSTAAPRARLLAEEQGEAFVSPTATAGAGTQSAEELTPSISADAEPIAGGGFGVETEVDPDIGLVPLTVQFRAVLDDGVPAPLSFHWDFGDGGAGASNATSHTYLVPGTFTASITVTNGVGQTVRRNVEIQVDGRD